MKKLAVLLVITLGSFGHLSAQTEEVQQLLLNVEKLAQLKQILVDMKKGYQVLSSGYAVIRDVSEGNFRLHQEYLDGLLQVSPAVRQYQGVARILQAQVQLVDEARQAGRRFRQGGAFSAQELDYLQQVYDRLYRQSLDQLEALTRVLSDRQLRMSDHERLQAIDALSLETEEALRFLRHFNRGMTLLGLQRVREQQDIQMAKHLYGLTN